MDSENASLLTNRAAAYLMLSQYREALADCNAAIVIDAANSKSYFRKATALKGMGRLDEAIAAYDAGLERDVCSDLVSVPNTNVLCLKTGGEQHCKQ